MFPTSFKIPAGARRWTGTTILEQTGVSIPLKAARIYHLEVLTFSLIEKARIPLQMRDR